jgi:fructose-bisphosphate aldolase, class II
MKASELIQNAKKNKFAIGAFNAANTETLKAIIQAAVNSQSPIIIEASDGEVNYIGMHQLVALVKCYREETGLPIIINLDHAKDFEICKQAVDAGFDYVHIDGSKLPLDENIKVTKQVVEYAHAHGVMVEGEMDHIQGSSADHTNEDPSLYEKPEYYTNPQKAKEFVEATGIDVFASFIGNLHGVYAKEMRLKFDIFKELTDLLPNTYFSLHGGSGINADDVRKAIQMGIVKVNVNSEMRIAFKETLQKSLNETDEVAIYKITPPAIEAVQKVVEDKIAIFGSGGSNLPNPPEEISSLV